MTNGARSARSAVWNAASNYLGTFVMLGSGFLLTPFVVHHLGATKYALWVLLGSLTDYAALMDFGIAGATVKYVAEYEARGDLAEARGMVATALRVYLVLGFLAVILIDGAVVPLFIHVFNVPPSEHDLAVMFLSLSGVGIGLAIPANATTAVLRGLHRWDLANYLVIFSTVMSVTGTVAVLLAGAGLIGMAAVSIVVIVTTQVPAIWLIYRIAPELRFGLKGARRSFIRPVIGYSSSLFLLTLGNRLQTKTDEFVIGAFLPIHFVTPYAIARRLSDLPQTVTNQFLKLLMPIASGLEATGQREELRALYVLSTRITVAVFLPLGCVLVILAAPFLTVWLDASYAKYSNLVLILVSASFCITTQWPAGVILQGIARHRRLAVIGLVSGAANLVLSIVLLHPFGLTGVALGTFFPWVVESMVVVMPYATRTIGVPMRTVIAEGLLPPVVPAVPTAVVLFALREVVRPTSIVSLALLGGSALALYVLGYFLLVAREYERSLAGGLVTRLRGMVMAQSKSSQP